MDTLLTRSTRSPGALCDIAPVLLQTSTFRAPDDASFIEMANTPRHTGYYTRDGNPTVAEAERLLAALEGAQSCLLTASRLRRHDHQGGGSAAGR